MVSSLFTQYECDFVHLLKAIEDRTAVLSAPTSTSADKRKNLAKGLKELNEAEACLKQMEMEIRMNALAIEDAGTAEKVAFHSSNFRNAQTSFFSRKAEVERQLLLDRTGSEAAAALEASQAARLLSTSASLQQGTQRVEVQPGICNHRLGLHAGRGPAALLFLAPAFASPCWRCPPAPPKALASLSPFFCSLLFCFLFFFASFFCLFSFPSFSVRRRPFPCAVPPPLHCCNCLPFLWLYRLTFPSVGTSTGFPPSPGAGPFASAQEAQRLALESEDLGVQITGSLGSHREIIMRTRSNVALLSENLSTSSRILGGMARRAARHRLVLYGVLASVAAVVAFLILRMVLPWLKLWR
eukprot:GHVT01038899.1.p1 GENE.GHVT01038899.1~~GHVT01038899.1.p1  ORF type:complete len:355 (+),score=73.19 GHVT01038899.1:1585-2649(+)